MSHTVAVLGANGFIGGRTVEMMRLLGWAEPRPVVRRAEALAQVCRFALDARVADARDELALREAFLGCETVVHAVAGDHRTILGTLAPVYRAADQAGVSRLIYLSTASVHGQDPAPGTDETSPLTDQQPIAYNNFKVRAEAQLAALRRTGEVEIVLLRPGIVHGPKSAWTAGLADELLAGQAYLVGRGRGVCNSIYIDNLVHAIRLAASAPHVDGQAFLVSDAEEITWYDLVRPIVEALGYRMEDLPDPPVAATHRTLLRRLRHTPKVVEAYRRLPEPLRHALQAGYASYRSRHNKSDEKTHTQNRVEASHERALLHQCGYRLPSTRAKERLGFEPIVAFPEAVRRSIAWLKFAGYPTVD
jgi:nucleoside-diphosphate-sugar epimerase